MDIERQDAHKWIKQISWLKAKGIGGMQPSQDLERIIIAL